MWNDSHYKLRFENAHKMRAQQSGIAAKVKVIFFLKLAAKFQIFNTQPRIAMYVERYSSPSTFWEPTREMHTYESQKLPSSTWRLCIEQTRSCSMYSWNRSQGHPRSSYTSLFIYFLMLYLYLTTKDKTWMFRTETSARPAAVHNWCGTYAAWPCHRTGGRAPRRSWSYFSISNCSKFWRRLSTCFSSHCSDQSE